jgi:hypothetical protein
MSRDLESNNNNTDDFSNGYDGSKNAKKCFACSMFTGLILFMLIIILVFQIIVPYGESSNYIQHDCYIGRVEYPTSLPSGENGGNSWAECDCGKRCQSWSPCISIFTNISGNEIKLGNDYYDGPFSCTFHDSICLDGEDYRIIENYMEESYQTYLEYFNKTIPCYIYGDKDIGYINIALDETELILYSVAIGILLLIFICINLPRSESNT